jgi:hypothetical protein
VRSSARHAHTYSDTNTSTHTHAHTVTRKLYTHSVYSHTTTHKQTHAHSHAKLYIAKKGWHQNAVIRPPPHHFISFASASSRSRVRFDIRSMNPSELSRHSRSAARILNTVSSRMRWICDIVSRRRALIASDRSACFALSVLRCSVSSASIARSPTLPACVICGRPPRAARCSG